MRSELTFGLPLIELEQMSHDEIDPSSKFQTPRTESPRHRPVMVEEMLELLAPRSDTTVVDCTVGMGGHSLAMLPRLMPTGRVIAIDQDDQALQLAKTRLTEFSSHIEFVHENFRHLPELLARHGISQVQGLVADLGISSLHVDQAERGFSFLRDGPLDMRMDQHQSTTAAVLIRELSEDALAHLIFTYGEERWATRIARRIVTVRKTQPIGTTTQLARVISDAVPARRDSWRIHPATRTFQALRIAVNEELAALEELLRVLPNILAPGGRAVIISFHSLEDRVVKQAFRQGAQAGQFRLLMKKPCRPSEAEMRDNPRSRSAKLRAVERLT